MLHTSPVHPRPSYSPTLAPPIRSARFYRVTHGTEDTMMASGLMLSSLARLSSSVVMRHAASAASEQQSRRDYIRTPRKVADEADIVPLVLDAGMRQQVAEEVCRCGTGDKRLVFVFNKTGIVLNRPWTRKKTLRMKYGPDFRRAGYCSKHRAGSRLKKDPSALDLKVLSAPKQRRRSIRPPLSASVVFAARLNSPHQDVMVPANS
ncbi:hypothetical protein EDB85DRAFT_2144793 [Lactarius pseudohatsudake]|nr:hypothetical protein EDB85DRAFT_2144793 [Lactarius pseudohatsudake]